MRRAPTAIMQNQSRWDWFLYYTERYAKHGRFDALHLAIWYLLLMLDSEDVIPSDGATNTCLQA